MSELLDPRIRQLLGEIRNYSEPELFLLAQTTNTPFHFWKNIREGNWQRRDRKKPVDVSDLVKRQTTGLHLAALAGLLYTSPEYLQRVIFGQISYRRWSEPKKSGGRRHFAAPCKEIKELQQLILEKFLYRFGVSTIAHAFVPGRSLVTNVLAHARFGARSALCVDLEDAYPSVSATMIEKVFDQLLGYIMQAQTSDKELLVRMKQMFNLAPLLTQLTILENELPQGAPTSPYLLNLVFLEIDRMLIREFKKKGFCVTRYCDDIAVSSWEAAMPRQALPVLGEIVERFGFRLAVHKTRFFDGRRGAPRITGLSIVEGRVVIPQKARKTLRGILRGIAGYQRRIIAGQEVGFESEKMVQVLAGVNGFIKMVYGSAAPKELEDPLALCLALKKSAQEVKIPVVINKKLLRKK